MKIIWVLATMTALLGTPNLMVDFGEKQEGSQWKVINDGVMGGLSKGKLLIKQETMLFQGNVSLDNYGGFTSMKSPFEKMDLSDFEKVKIRMTASGQTFSMTFETDETWFAPYFKAPLATISNEWQVIEVSLDQFKQYQLGQSDGRAINKGDLANVFRLGIITSQKKAGTFELEVDYIRFE